MVTPTQFNHKLASTSREILTLEHQKAIKFLSVANKLYPKYLKEISKLKPRL